MSKQSSVALSKLRNKFLRLPVANCPFRVVTILLSYCDRDTYQSWPSQATIQKSSGYGRSAVNRALRTIKAVGMFTCETVGANEMRRRFPEIKANAKHLYTVYTLNIDSPAWKDADAINQDYAMQCSASRECVPAGTR